MFRRRPNTPYLKGFIFWLLVYLFLAPPVWGANCIPSGVRNFRFFENGFIPCMLGNLANFLITVSPFVAVALLVVGGIRYMASSGDPKTLQSSKQFITWVILGFLAVFGTIFIFRLVTAILGGASGVNLPF